MSEDEARHLDDEGSSDEGEAYGDDGDYDEGALVTRSRQKHAWLPPGSDAEQQPPFGLDLDQHFLIPGRLMHKAGALVEAVNDFHYAMLNDHPRNEFYSKALEKACAAAPPVVLEIGTGSGLLAMLAARAGAKHVYAIEASNHMAAVATKNIEANGLADQVTVVNLMSTDTVAGRDIPAPANVLVSEILGTLLLGESALQYVADARERLLAPGAEIVPAGGTQFAALVESKELATITAVDDWSGFDLRHMNSLKDTVSVVFTKQYGFRFSSIEHNVLADPVPIAEVDFYVDGPGCLPEERKFSVQVKQDGICHALLFYWEVYSDRAKTLRMSTDPAETTDNFPRDMQWGQALQLVEDFSDGEQDPPQPLVVKAGEWLDMTVRYSFDSAVFQCHVSRRSQVVD